MGNGKFHSKTPVLVVKTEFFSRPLVFKTKQQQNSFILTRKTNENKPRCVLCIVCFSHNSHAYTVSKLINKY